MNEDRVTAVLRRARQLVERGWCQRTEAEDAAGNGVSVSDRDAVAFCMRGALRRASHEAEDAHNEPVSWGDLFVAAHERVERTLPRNETVTHYNDRVGRRLTTILRKLDEAAGGK